MRLFITLSFLFTTTWCLSQQKFVFLFKNNGQYVHSSDSADYIRVITQPDSGSNLYNVSEYYIKGETKLIGKTSTIDPTKFEGSCIRYYKNSNKQSITNYSNGFIVGVEYDYYPTGKLYQIIKHPETANIQSPPLKSFLIIAENDSTGKALVTNSNGYYKGYNDSLKNIVEEGNIRNGLRDSIWTGYDSSLEIKFKATYVDGNLISGISVGKIGDTVKYDKSRKIEAHYKGTPTALADFLVNHFRPSNYYNSNYGKVTVSFTIEKDGTLSNFKAINHISDDFGKAVIDAIRQSGKWVPGTMYGRTIVDTRSVSFNLIQDN